MSNWKICLTCACLAILMAACQPAERSPGDYTRWLAENQTQLSTQTTQSGLLFSLNYLPADWLALREAGAENTEALGKVRQEYGGLEYYRLRVALQSGQGDVLQFRAAGTDEYYQRVEYFSFGLQHDIYLLAGQDTLPCRLFHFERNYGAAPYMDFMLGFEEKEGNNFDHTLMYHERVYSNILLTLTIPKENIQRIPKLKI